MTQEIINIGKSANSGDGDDLRSAFTKTNSNFTELYNIVGSNGQSNGAADFVLVGSHGGLENSRLLTAGYGIALDDAGQGSTLTVRLTDNPISPGIYSNATVTIDSNGHVVDVSSGAGSGYTGSAGNQGYVGSAGPKGYTGSQSTVIGYTGSVGYTGSSGAFAAVGYTGSQGTVGYTGSIGPTAIGGAYVYTQASPATTWTITHNLGVQYVNVEVIDSSGNSLVGTYDYPTVNFTSSNTVTLTFTTATSGYAAVTSGGGQIGYAGSSGTNGYTGSLGYVGSIGYTGSSGTFVRISTGNQIGRAHV